METFDNEMAEFIFGDYEDTEMYFDDEWIIRGQRKAQREQFEKVRNIKRDKRGRLNKGALLAKKDCCNEDEIWLRYMSGMSAKQIVDCMGCSSSTVYNVIKKYKEL